MPSPILCLEECPVLKDKSEFATQLCNGPNLYSTPKCKSIGLLSLSPALYGTKRNYGTKTSLARISYRLILARDSTAALWMTRVVTLSIAEGSLISLEIPRQARNDNATLGMTTQHTRLTRVVTLSLVEGSLISLEIPRQARNDKGLEIPRQARNDNKDRGMTLQPPCRFNAWHEKQCIRTLARFPVQR